MPTFTRLRTLIPAIFMGLATLAAAPAHAQNLLQNGSFELGTFANNGTGTDSLPLGSTALPGWTTTNAELAWLINGNNYGIATPYGSYFLDLTGYHDSAPYSGVTQTIATTAGQTYHFSFALGVDQGDTRYSGPVSATATVGDVSQTFTLTPDPNNQFNQWQTFGYDFTGRDTSTDVRIIGISTAGGQYIGLDNVSVTSNANPVPEASTTVSLGLLLLLGAGGLVAAKRKKACSSAV